MDENKWKGFVAVPETRELSCEGCALASSRDDDPTRVRCNREDDTPRCCAENRKDGRQIIWVPAPVEEEQRPEPKVVFATVRDDFDSNGEESGWSLECRFDDGQKYGAVTVDRPFPELAHRICDFLNAPQEVKITLSENTRNEALRIISEAPTPSPVQIVPTEERGFHGLRRVREWKATDEGVNEVHIPSAQNDDPMSKALGRHIEMVACEDDERVRRKLIELGWTPPEPHAQVLGAEYPTFLVPDSKADRNGVTRPDMSAVEKYLNGAPTPDEIEAFHATGYALVKEEVWEATRAMAEAFVTEPEPGDPPEVWQEWAALVEKYRARYEELRGDVP